MKPRRFSAGTVTTIASTALVAVLCAGLPIAPAHAQARGREEGHQNPQPAPKNNNDDPPARSSGSSSGDSQPARQREEAVQVQTTPSQGGSGDQSSWRERWHPFWDRGGYTVYRIYDCGQPWPENTIAALGSDPTPSRLVFVSDREKGDWELYTVRPDGRDLRRLTRRRGEESHPMFSPDGRFVVFAGRSEEGPLAPGGPSQTIWICDANNAIDAHQITPTRPGGTDSEPSFSPDGRSILFVSDRDGNPDLYMMDAVGGANVVRLTSDPAADTSPAWSPDGTRIVFTSTRGGATYRRLYVMGVKRGEPASALSAFTDTQGQPVTLDNGDIADPSFSPDGMQIAFAYRGDIYACRADGTFLRRLTKGFGDCSHPSWSPDGGAISFTALREDAYGVYLMRSDSGERMTSVRLTDRRSNAGTADWR